MLNDTAPVVDDRRRTQADGYWLTISGLAAERRVSKQAISKNIRRWAALGTPVSTRRKGRQVMVNVAEYDARKGEVGDLGRELGEQTKKTADVGTDPVYTREQARSKGYEADLKFIEREKQLGRLVEVETLRIATTKELAESRRSFGHDWNMHPSDDVHFDRSDIANCSVFD
jgi:hypothetical protein